MLRDEEGIKLGLKARKDGVDGAGSKNDVKMSNVEVTTQPSYTRMCKHLFLCDNGFMICSHLCTQGSSNGSGEPSNATSQEGTKLYMRVS